ncbi:MAG: acetyl-CoA hydrolase/transferase family protein [bacterium]
MGSWTHAYRSKRTSLEAAVQVVGPRSNVYMGGNAATPRTLAQALARRGEAIAGSRIAHVLLIGEDPFAEAAAAEQIRHLSWFVGPADRSAIAAGHGDYVPCHLSEIPRLIRAERPRIDTALLMTSPPDRHGLLSLGVEVLASQAAAECARHVIVQVNEQMPRVLGNSFVHIDDVDAIVEADEPLGELVGAAPTAVEQRIAEQIVALLPEGATLQLGIGGIPQAVIGLLEGRNDLGVHSEMISDGVMAAYEAGILSGRRKSRHRGKIVATFALGTRTFYDWLHENHAVEAHPCDHTNDPYQASQNDRLIAINSAISVDLTGQVNADSIGSRIYSGVGGQVDFIRAANLSREGRSIIAMPSTARDGTISRIVPRLAEGAGVVTSRADVDTIITEHGMAELHGQSTTERIEALIAIADPRFRDELEQEAKEELFYSRR